MNTELITSKNIGKRKFIPSRLNVGKYQCEKIKAFIRRRCSKNVNQIRYQIYRIFVLFTVDRDNDACRQTSDVCIILFTYLLYKTDHPIREGICIQTTCCRYRSRSAPCFGTWTRYKVLACYKSLR